MKKIKISQFPENITVKLFAMLIVSNHQISITISTKILSSTNVSNIDDNQQSPNIRMIFKGSWKFSFAITGIHSILKYIKTEHCYFKKIYFTILMFYFTNPKLLNSSIHWILDYKSFWTCWSNIVIYLVAWLNHNVVTWGGSHFSH